MCQTVFPSTELLSNRQIIALSCINLIVALANVSVNVLLIYSLLKLQLIKTISYKFILFLCISDCCVGLMPQILLACLLVAPEHHKCALEVVTQSLQAACCQFSVIMILIITMDRYLHMNYLTKYNRYMTKNRALLLLLVNIVICFIIVIANVLASTYKGYFIMHTTLLGLNTTVISFIFAIYARTYMSIRKRVKGIRLSSETSSILKGTLLTAGNALTIIPSKFIQRRNQYHLSFAKAMIFVLLALGLCYAPYLAIVSIVTYARFERGKALESGNAQVVLLYWSVILIYTNSFFNGIILVFSNKRMRRFISDIFCARSVQDSGAIANTLPMITIARMQAENQRDLELHQPQMIPISERSSLKTSAECKIVTWTGSL